MRACTVAPFSRPPSAPAASRSTWASVVQGLLLCLLIAACEGEPSRTTPSAPRAAPKASGPASASESSTYRPNTRHRLRRAGPFPLELSHRGEAIFVDVAYPDGAEGALPTVVWSHGGGATSKPNPRGKGWVELLVKAGYAVVKISHIQPDLKKVEARCTAGTIEGPEGPMAVSDCGAFLASYAGFMKPMDIRGVLDRLDAIEAATKAAKGVTVRFDRKRVALAGHSGGCAATLAVAGARRHVGPVRLELGHPLPRAFVCMSPAGVGDVGWREDSFGGIEEPILLATGSRDIKEGEGKSWQERSRVYDLIEGRAFTARLFLDHPRATHGAFNLGTSSRLLHATLKRAVIAFLGATVQGDEAARRHLEAGGVVQMWKRAKSKAKPTPGAPPTWCWKEAGAGACVPEE